MLRRRKKESVVKVEGEECDPRELTLNSFGKPSLLWWITIIALSIVVLTGIVAWVVQLQGGMAQAGYNDHAFWSIYVADVITFIGVSYGGAVISAILRLTGATWRAPLTRLAEGTAVITVLIGAALIVPHIGNPVRLWELVVRPNLSAPVFWDFIAVMTYTAASIVFFALPLVPDMALLYKNYAGKLGVRRSRLYASFSRGWLGLPNQRRVLTGALGLVSIMIIPLAVSVHSVLAWAFASTGRPWWHESIWAPQFVVAALYSGVALVIIVVAGFRRGYHLEGIITDRHFVRLGFILATFSATYLYLTFADLFPGAYVGEPGTAAVFTDLLVGRLAPWFWMFAILGGLLPLMLVALPWTRNIGGMVTAAAIVIPMMWIKRLLLVIGPANYDTITGAFGSYRFTWVSIAITMAAAAAVPLLLMLLFRVIPLLSIDEIEEIREEGLRANRHEFIAKGHDQMRTASGSQKSHRVMSLTGAVALIALTSMFSLGASNRASATDLHKPASIVFSGAEESGLVRLTARVLDSLNQPVPNTPVEFGFTTTEFDSSGQVASLGNTVSDTTGIASLILGNDPEHPYRPTSVGPQEFVATVSTVDGPPIVSKFIINVTVAHSAYTPAPRKPLASVGGGLVISLFTIVLTIWITLAVQVVRVRRVCQLSWDGALKGTNAPVR